MLTDLFFFFFFFFLIYATSKGKKQWHTCESRFHLAPPRLQQQHPAEETDSAEHILGRPATGRMEKQRKGRGGFILWQHLTCIHTFFFLTLPREIWQAAEEKPGTIPVQWSSSICGYPSLNSGFCFKASPLFWRIGIPKSFLCKTGFFALGYLRGLFSVTVFRNKQI